jgi:hypothetical protein
MPVYKTILAIAIGAMVSVSVFGCSDDDPVGTLQQSWTIGGSSDPSACGPVRAAQMRIVLTNSDGKIDATQFAPCADFHASVPLDPDRYAVAVTFLGPDGFPVSNTLLVPTIDIYSGQTTSIATDFTLRDFVR